MKGLFENDLFDEGQLGEGLVDEGQLGEGLVDEVLISELLSKREYTAMNGILFMH